AWQRGVDWAGDAGRTWHGGKVEQRWFIGAHSNVGGGYEDDDLAQLPLEWLMRECRTLGLVFRDDAARPTAEQGYPDRFVPLLEPEKTRRVPPEGGGTTKSEETLMKAKPPRVRDSYSEFAKGLWRHVIRSKREYRHIGPPRELQNKRAVKSVNEVLDPSVIGLLEANATLANVPRYHPPN